MKVRVVSKQYIKGLLNISRIGQLINNHKVTEKIYSEDLMYIANVKSWAPDAYPLRKF